MKSSKLSLILRIVSVALLAVAFFALFIAYSTEIKTTVSNKGRTVSSASVPTADHNFFDRMGNNYYKKFGVKADMMLVIFLILSIVGAALSFFIDKPFLNIILAALPLVVVILCIIYMNKSVGYVFEMSPTYGTTLRTDTSIRFYNSILPTMIPSILAFVTMLINAIVSFKGNKQTPAAD